MADPDFKTAEQLREHIAYLTNLAEFRFVSGLLAGIAIGIAITGLIITAVKALGGGA